MGLFQYIVEQFTLHSHSLSGAFRGITPHELNQHFSSMHALYLTRLNFAEMVDLGWAYYPISDKGNDFRGIADGYFYNKITNDFITMQFKFRTSSILHSWDINALTVYYSHTSNFIEIGYSNNFIYQKQIDWFNLNDPHHHYIIRDYSKRYGVINAREIQAVDEVFCWYINNFNKLDYINALKNYHENIKTITSVHVPSCACGMDSYSISPGSNPYMVSTVKQHLIQNLTGLPLIQCK